MNEIAERIERMSIPEPNTGCWLWLGTLNRGYGQLGGFGLAHREAYKAYVGEIPTGRRAKYGPDGGQSAAIRAVWARMTPEQRSAVATEKWEKRRAKYGQAGRAIPSRVAWAGKTPEERAEHGRKIKEGRRLALLKRVADSRQLDEELVPFVRHWRLRGHFVESIAVAFCVPPSEIKRVVA